MYLEVLSYAVENMHGNVFCPVYFMNRILLCNVIFVSAVTNHCFTVLLVTIILFTFLLSFITEQKGDESN